MSENHSCNLHTPLCGRSCLHSADAARCAALIQEKSPANCDVRLTESFFRHALKYLTAERDRKSAVFLENITDFFDGFFCCTVVAAAGGDTGHQIVFFGNSWKIKITFVFIAAHVYGDAGTFTDIVDVIVCLKIIGSGNDHIAGWSGGLLLRTPEAHGVLPGR